MDLLYEPRCSTNYRSIDEYAVDVDDEHVRDFHNGVLHLMDMGLLTYEGQVALYARTGPLRTELIRWGQQVRSVGGWALGPAQARLDALEAAGL